MRLWLEGGGPSSEAAGGGEHLREGMKGRGRCAKEEGEKAWTAQIRISGDCHRG